MKVATLVARILLGLIFLVFGLNGFLHFIPMPVPPPGLARDYFIVLSTSSYLTLPFILQVVGGVMLLANFFVPLALVLLAPVIVNILMFHVLMSPEGIVPGLVAAALWIVVANSVRPSFAGLFQNRPAPALQA